MQSSHVPQMLQFSLAFVRDALPSNDFSSFPSVRATIRLRHTSTYVPKRNWRFVAFAFSSVFSLSLSFPSFFPFFFTIFFLQPFPSDFPILFFLHCHLLLSWSIISLFSPLFQLSISIPSLSLSLFPFLLLCLFPFFHSPSFPLSLFLIASSFSFHSFFLFPTLPSVNHGTFIISTLEIGEWILPLQNEDDTRQFACVINNWLKNVHKTQKHIKQKFRVEALLYLGYISLIVLLIIRIRIKIHSLITTKTRVEYTLK